MNNTVTVTQHEGFESLNLIPPILRAIREENYRTPTPIQAQAIPHLLDGRDLLGCAQTGTGKTAAFALPILQKLVEPRKQPAPKSARALILAPTRELAVQIDESFRVYGRHLKITTALVYGGVKPMQQIRAMRRGVDVLVATPGRLLDLMQQGHLRLDSVEILVLDEADRMLDMGFLPDMRRILSAVPSTRQSMLFSATLPNEIRNLTRTYLNDPVHVSVSPQSSTVDRIKQKVLFVDQENKRALLESVLSSDEITRAIVFTRTKHGANKIAKGLNGIRVRTEAIHGNKSQAARIQALEKFRSGKVRVLVATDLASRGLDVDDISHVINYDLPEEAESYVHRIGRTARAGALGVAISFCSAGERFYLRNIENKIKQAVEVDTDHSYHSANVAALKGNSSESNGGYRNRNNGGKRRPPFSGKGRNPRSGTPTGKTMTFRPRSSRTK